MNLNIPNSEILKSFNEKRDEFEPYGLTFELWSPGIMQKPDRHNEVEINYCADSTITYLFQDKKIKIPPKKLTIFWGLVPHQIIQFKGTSPYFVCTIPLSQFLGWKLPQSFVDRILKGEVLFETSDDYSTLDEFFINHWLNDTNTNVNHNEMEISLLEMRARLLRMAGNNLSIKEQVYSSIQLNEISNVERIAIFIAQNYQNPIKVAEIGKAVELHPDYANSIFKKAFGVTISEYITEERIANTKRKLVSTDDSVIQISLECGFNSVSRFNEAFRKINGCTPREFRKKYH